MADFIFDLETFVRAYIDLRKEWHLYYEDYKGFWQEAVETGFNPDANFQEFLQVHRKIKSKSVEDVLGFMFELHKNPSATDDVKNTVKFVAEQVFYPKNDGDSRGYDNTSYLQMFLNRLNKFKDKDLVYDALKILKSTSDYKRPCAEKYGLQIPKKRMSVYKDIATMLANNQNATTDDILEMIYFAETQDNALKIINDVFAKTDEDLDVELNKDVPNTDNVGVILSKPGSLIRTVLDGRDLSPELSKAIKDKEVNKEFYKLLNQWQEIAKEKYDFDNVVGSGDAQYVTNYENTLEQQNIDLINANEKLLSDNFKLTQSRDQYRDNYEHEKELRARLLRKYDDERAAVASINSMLQSALEVIAAYEISEQEVGKAGVFKKGEVKVKMREAIENANANLKRAQEKEAKRKAALLARQREAGEAISI